MIRLEFKTALQEKSSEREKTQRAREIEKKIEGGKQIKCFVHKKIGKNEGKKPH